jgi:hypothetical protein
MPNRRDFLKGVTGATAALLAGGSRLADAGVRSLQVGAAAPARRREISIAGKRITRTVSFRK